MEQTETHALLHEPEFWIAVAFIIFAGIFLKFVWPPIAQMLDKRSREISKQLEKATRLREEAEALLALYQQQREEQAREAESIIAGAKRDADELRKRAEADLKQNIERRSQQAVEKIARAEAEATSFIRSQMIEVATKAVTQVVRSELEKSKEDPAIAQAIDAIAKQIH